MNPVVTALGVIGLVLAALLYQQHAALEATQSEYDAYKGAQAQAVADQARKAKDALEAQGAAEAAAKVAHDKALQERQPLIDSLTGRVRALTVAVHAGGVHPAVADSGGVPPGPGGAGEARGAEQEAGDVAGAARDAAAACLHTYADWQAIIALSPKP